jgi:hypothetical protein
MKMMKLGGKILDNGMASRQNVVDRISKNVDLISTPIGGQNQPHFPVGDPGRWLTKVASLQILAAREGRS